MATLDDINNTPEKQRHYPSTDSPAQTTVLTQQGAGNTQPPVAPPTAQPQPSEKQKNYPSTESPAQEEAAAERPAANVQQTASTAQPPTTTEQQSKRTLSYADIIQQMSPYKQPTEEELEEQRKRQRREEIFAAIGDGLNAFHQAYSHSVGKKPLTQNVSMSGKLRERYDKLKKERDAAAKEYLSAYMRALQADDEVARDERNWRRTLKRDEESDRRDERDFNERKRRADQQQENWQQNFDRQGEQWKQEFEQRKKQQGVQNAIAWAQHNLSVQAQKDNKELRQQQIAAQGARAVRGKQLAFSDGNGNSVAIYENVWKGSMEQVYDVIVADFMEQKAKNRNANVPFIDPTATAQQKDDFVKQHWHKSAAGRQMMQTLAGIDPANMTSTTTTDGSGGLGWGAEGNGNDNETDW